MTSSLSLFIDFRNCGTDVFQCTASVDTLTEAESESCRSVSIVLEGLEEDRRWMCNCQKRRIIYPTGWDGSSSVDNRDFWAEAPGVREIASIKDETGTEDIIGSEEIAGMEEVVGAVETAGTEDLPSVEELPVLEEVVGVVETAGTEDLPSVEELPV
ncbi:MAG: hypothetical protein Q9227_008088 [Pyrenula ochraceoflavens]